MKRAVITVTGRVQGVSFRAYSQVEANRLGLAGYVRNRPDGSVEIVSEGEEFAVKELVEWARRGPSLAHVQDVRVEYSEPVGAFRGFEIRH